MRFRFWLGWRWGTAGGAPALQLKAKKSEPPEAVFGHGVREFFVDLVNLGKGIVVEGKVGGGEGGFELVD